MLLARVRPRPWVLKVRQNEGSNLPHAQSRNDLELLCRAKSGHHPHWILRVALLARQLGDKRRSHPVLRADSYPLAELAAAAAACAPSQLYARHLSASFVARLPTSIRCSCC